jgi:hypothetical protein
MENKHAPAFPLVAEDDSGMMINMGMSLRDYFAARAMQGIVSKEVSHVSWVDEYAKNAYKMADAMLKAREA